MVLSFDRLAYFGFVNSSLQIWIMANGSGSAVINVTLTEGIRIASYERSVNLSLACVGAFLILTECFYMSFDTLKRHMCKLSPCFHRYPVCSFPNTSKLPTRSEDGQHYFLT